MALTDTATHNAKPGIVHVTVNGSLEVDVKERVSLVAKSGPGRRGRMHELIVGEEAIRSTGGWAWKYRLVDRAGDRYCEIVIEQSTGTVLRFVDQPLSVHRGRGSARRKQKK